MSQLGLLTVPSFTGLTGAVNGRPSRPRRGFGRSNMRDGKVKIKSLQSSHSINMVERHYKRAPEQLGDFVSATTSHVRCSRERLWQLTAEGEIVAVPHESHGVKLWPALFLPPIYNMAGHYGLVRQVLGSTKVEIGSRSGGGRIRTEF
ncbi:hypothetical protein FB451DRAFT_1181835 [Mycena latifolia]|nr:hypothetical protein FB451DRAFT_1181835 [Mycena latifolia]